MADETMIRVTVDRIEGDIAVLLSREAHRWLLPAELLPDGAREGDVLTVSLRRDPEGTRRRLDGIRRLQRRLLDRTEEADGKG
jgi:hypothetical protein